MFCLDTILTNRLDSTKTIIPRARMGPNGPWASCAIDSKPIRARGIIAKYRKERYAIVWYSQVDK